MYFSLFRIYSLFSFTLNLSFCFTGNGTTIACEVSLKNIGKSGFYKTTNTHNKSQTVCIFSWSIAHGAKARTVGLTSVISGLLEKVTDIDLTSGHAQHSYWCFVHTGRCHGMSKDSPHKGPNTVEFGRFHFRQPEHAKLTNKWVELLVIIIETQWRSCDVNAMMLNTTAVH